MTFPYTLPTGDAVDLRHPRDLSPGQMMALALHGAMIQEASRVMDGLDADEQAPECFAVFRQTAGAVDRGVRILCASAHDYERVSAASLVDMDVPLGLISTWGDMLTLHEMETADDLGLGLSDE